MGRPINRSWFDAYEIQLELYEVGFYPAIPNGMHRRLTVIPLKRSHLRQIPACKRLIRKSEFAHHCVIFRTNADLHTILKEEHKALMLQVTLKHGLSGLSKICRMDYRGCSCIRLGSFCFGDNFEIK